MSYWRLLIFWSGLCVFSFFFFFQAEDGIRDGTVTGVQTCALPIYLFGQQPGGGAVDLLGQVGRHLERLRPGDRGEVGEPQDRKSTRLNSSHSSISYAVFCLKKKKNKITDVPYCLQNYDYGVGTAMN